MENKISFVSLKQVLLILTTAFLLTTSIQSQVVSNSELPTNVEVKVYPNPATSFITFDLKEVYQSGMSIQIFHMLGRKMQELFNVSEKTTVNLNDYTRGLYIYHLRNKAGQLIKSGKFNVSK